MQYTALSLSEIAQIQTLLQCCCLNFSELALNVLVSRYMKKSALFDAAAAVGVVVAVLGAGFGNSRVVIMERLKGL